MGRTEEHESGGDQPLLWTESVTEADMSKKGKSRMRARTDILRSNVANARRKQRQVMKSYDRTGYDGNESEEVA